jgi:hypothetical protein
VAPGLRDSKAGDDLVRAACGDAPEVETVAALPSAALAEVEGHGGGSTPELLGKGGVTLGDGGERVAEAADQLERNVEGIEGHVTTPLGWGSPSPAQVP